MNFFFSSRIMQTVRAYGRYPTHCLSRSFSENVLNKHTFGTMALKGEENILCKKPNLARESPATTPQNAREQGARKSNKSACMAHTKRLSSPTHLHFLLPFSLESVDRS